LKAPVSARRLAISVFVVLWTALFHYETLRWNYLRPALGRELPKFPLLFPPAGWIMFFRIDRTYGFAEVYGIRNGKSEQLDPHDIFVTSALGYDNIHRNVLSQVVDRRHAPRFCAYLGRKFPAFEGFAVVYGEFSDVVGTPDATRRAVAYRCEGRR
jgi:hypothetical protein